MIPAHLATQAQAENLTIVHDLIVNKEQRFPDIAYSGRQLDPASRPDALVVHGQEYHTSYWGHLGLLDIDGRHHPAGLRGLSRHRRIEPVPDERGRGRHRACARRPGGLRASLRRGSRAPRQAAGCAHRRAARRCGAGQGRLHGNRGLQRSSHHRGGVVPAAESRLSDSRRRRHRCHGEFRLAARPRGHEPGVRAHARGRAFGRRGGRARTGLPASRRGRSFATNGPLLGFTLGGAGPGEELKFAGPQAHVAFSARLQSIVAVDHLDLVCNGRVVRAFTLGASADHADLAGTIPLDRSGWCVLRASTDAAREAVLDNYVYATTSPMYVTIAGARPLARGRAVLPRLDGPPRGGGYGLSRLEQRAGEARRAGAHRAGEVDLRRHAVAGGRRGRPLLGMTLAAVRRPARPWPSPRASR